MTDEPLTDDARSDWSVPERDVLDAVGDLLDAGREGVLATVIGVEGNAYRRPGAKMVLAPDGTGVGAITAGCLEDEVVAIADDVVAAGRPRVETYDLMEDDDVWGLGVGCNGIIDVLLEPIDDSLRPMVEAARDGEHVAALTVLSAPEATEDSMGDRAYVDADGGFSIETDADSVFAEAADSLTEPAADLLERGRASTVEVEAEAGPVEVFVDGIRAPPSLVVFGTGHDVAPVAELASRNGFRTTVIAFRGADADEDRFPAADEVLSTSPATLADAHEFDEDTHAVVMTHNFVDDRIAVEELLDTPVPYIGLMGPRERFEEMLEDFADEGRTFDDATLDRLYTPIGLDLGGDSPSQIAHSIVAEVLAVANDRTPRHLSERAGPIHDRVSIAPDE